MGRAEIDDEFEPQGGDSACWLDQVCPECGRMIEGDDHVCETEAPESS